MDLNIDWEKVSGLLPVIVQDEKTLQVLMLAYMDENAYKLTCKSGFAHYFSRTKQRIWKKGESSGHVQHVKKIFLDCDNDTLLLHVKQVGVACHTGRVSCFFKQINSNTITKDEVLVDLSSTYGVIDELYHIIQERKNADINSSYVAKLLNGHENSMLKKVVEEAGEFCFAYKDKNEKEIIYEAADVIFHLLVSLGAANVHPDRVLGELKRRFGTSGIEEKNSRNAK